jgi:phage-related tail fiber protein
MEMTGGGQPLPGNSSQRERMVRNVQWSRDVMGASERLRHRGSAAGSHARALRKRLAATLADVAAAEEKIARTHEELASETTGNASSYRRVAADARGAIRRSAEIRAQLAADQDCAGSPEPACRR